MGVPSIEAILTKFGSGLNLGLGSCAGCTPSSGCSVVLSNAESRTLRAASLVVARTGVGCEDVIDAVLRTVRFCCKDRGNVLAWNNRPEVDDGFVLLLRLLGLFVGPGLLVNCSCVRQRGRCQVESLVRVL